MRHINLAVEEMFNAAHMQLLSNCCRMDKILLAALLLELRAKGKAFVSSRKSRKSSALRAEIMLELATARQKASRHCLRQSQIAWVGLTFLIL